jgi:hypothetical protein
VQYNSFRYQRRVCAPPPLSVSQVPKELVESPSRLCPTADPTASPGPGLAGRVYSTSRFSLPVSLPLSNLTHFSLTGTVLRTHTCHHTQSFQTRPPPCFPGLSTSLAEGPNYHPPLQLPKQLEASLHSPGLSFLFRLCHYPLVPIHGHRLYVVPASLFALFLIMCASTTIHI